MERANQPEQRQYSRDFMEDQEGRDVRYRSPEQWGRVGA